MGRLFGTDGVRGIANEQLTCELAMKLGRAAAAVLSDHTRERPSFVIGMDPRISSEMLSCALTAGLCSVGADVLSLGVVPTPAVAYLAGKYKADAGVMISASHNSAEFNGIKIFSGDGFKLADELEEKIESIVLDGAKLSNLKVGKDIGRVVEKTTAVEDYISHLTSTIPQPLSGISLAVDCANGAASGTAKQLFDELGADCRMLFDRPDGLNINDGCGSMHIDALQEYVVQNGLDVGIAFDGDADRCLCVDGCGNIVDGDFIMAICALDMLRHGRLAKKTVVGTIMANMGFARFCEENEIRMVSTKVGDRYVLEEMLMEDYNFGGEQSGHIIFRDYATTGDGQLTAIQLLSVLKREKMSLSQATKIMTKYPQVMINVEVPDEAKVKFYMDDEIRAAIDREKERLGRDGRAVIRVSGTEPLIRIMIEGTEEAKIREAAENIATVIRCRLT